MQGINLCLFELDIFHEKLLWNTIFSLFVTWSFNHLILMDQVLSLENLILILMKIINININVSENHLTLNINELSFIHKKLTLDIKC